MIADVLGDYVIGHGADLTDKERLGYAVKALLPFWGHQPVRSVREGTCKAYVAFRKKQGVSPQTASREIVVLSAAIRYDWREGRLTEIVATWKPPHAEPKDRWLTRDEAAKLIRAARSDPRCRWHLPLFILIGLYTAARKEAVLSLRWPQVDLERKLIDLNPEGRERTSKGRPTLPIPDRLMTFLRYARKRGSDLGSVLMYQGKPIGSIKHAFSSSCDRAGLEDVTPHTLRHTAASWMTQAGVPFPEIARYLGHADSRITEKTYAHHSPDYLAGAKRALDNRSRR